MISNGSTVYHSATMPPPGPPLHFLHLGDIPVPLKTTGLVQCARSSDPAHLHQLFLSPFFLLPLVISPGLDYYMRQPRPMVRILCEAIRALDRENW
jgi:hypothetical protein